jgi:hypothetical protein
MSRQTPSFLDALKRRWSRWTGGSAAEKPALPEVIVHDPAAQGPQDLDDVFRDRKVQERVAETIARAARSGHDP